LLQAIFEYQTAILRADRHGLSNASGYDGTTVARGRVLRCEARDRRDKIVVRSR